MMFVLFSLTAIIGSSQEAPVSQRETPVNYELASLQESGLRLDSKDGLPVLIGTATAEMIIKHRPEFSDAYEKVHIDPELIKRWEAIEKPCVIVAVFGSWCGDSHRWLPDIIKLAETTNPFISVYWIGTNRKKTIKKSAWPLQSISQKVKKVPTFWLFTPIPGGKTKLVGSIAENPPKTDQTMAEALLELMEQI